MAQKSITAGALANRAGNILVGGRVQGLPHGFDLKPWQHQVLELAHRLVRAEQYAQVLSTVITDIDPAEADAVDAGLRVEILSVAASIAKLYETNLPRAAAE